MRLVAENLTLERGGRRLVAGLSFALGAGEALIVTGPNGAGKSSLLRGLAGLIGFSAGRAGLDGGAAELTTAEQTHYLGHADSLKGALTARENLSFWAALLGGAGLSETEALRRLGLPHVADFPVRALSAGQKRRVALARLVNERRPLWILDEPYVALDPAAIALVAGLIAAHLEREGLVVLTTHQPVKVAGAKLRELSLTPASAA